jgi:two-component system, OmpR family, alkaline phosphatase synthesis response regulator PhoP
MSKKILIAEDEVHVAKIIQFKLEKNGYEVIHKENGKEALAYAISEKPDLILLDVMMPGMNGFDVLKAIKNHPDIKDIPTVMLTALGQESDTVKGFDLGVEDYIVKPFRPAELLSRINRILK